MKPRMQAAYYNRQGKAEDVLVVGEIPRPEPGPGEVRVRIHVSALNPTDIKARTGFSGPMLFPQIVPHQDGAGIIDAVGEGVPPSRVGERVWVYLALQGRAVGTAGACTVVSAEQAVPLPAGVSFEVGACLGVPALTAHRCLFADGDIRGRRVLVHGGAGAVGTAAILLAKWAGAWVAATVSRPEQAEVAQKAGADLVINRYAEDVAARVKVATSGAGVERILDVELAANLATDLACLAPAGVISAYAVRGVGDALSLPLFEAMKGGCVFRFVYLYTVPAEAKRAGAAAVNACLAAGAYHPAIGLRVPLERIVEAHQAQEAGTMIGKVLIDLDP